MTDDPDDKRLLKLTLALVVVLILVGGVAVLALADRDPQVPAPAPDEVAESSGVVPDDREPERSSEALDRAFSGGGEPTCDVFPGDNAWNTPVVDLPVHERSDEWVASIGRDDTLHPDFGTVWEGQAIGIPYVIVAGDQPGVPVDFDYADESDPGPYPIPADPPLEAGDDRHLIVVDDDRCLLYELFEAATADGGASWHAGSGAIFDLTSNQLRPDTWTSADAAGLPIFAGLVRYEEVVDEGLIDHAIRITVETSQRAFIHPATHWASTTTDPSVPPMGARFRMSAEYDCTSFSTEVQVLCTAMKTYGLIVADNGSDWFVSGAPDRRWDDEALADLDQIPGGVFEVVDTGAPVITPASLEQ